MYSASGTPVLATTHLKESLDEKLKFNEGWWFHDLRRTGKPR
jgi:hypothetical protein